MGTRGETLDELRAKYLSPDGKWVNVDAHILATPVIMDVDNDGHHEVIIAVSYFFDQVSLTHYVSMSSAVGRAFLDGPRTHHPFYLLLLCVEPKISF
jgi:hypothetical protein